MTNPFKKRTTNLDEIHTYVSDLQAIIELREQTTDPGERDRLQTVIAVMEHALEYLVGKLTV